MKELLAKSTILLSPLIPSITYAQTRLTTVEDVASGFGYYVNIATQILITLAVVYIIIHIVRYLIIGGSDPENRKLAGNSIMYGVIGLFVILSIWGLVNILVNSFSFERNGPRKETLDRLIKFD